MMKKFLPLVVAGMASAAMAGGPDVAPAMNETGLFVGMGGSYNSVAMQHSPELTITGSAVPAAVTALNPLLRVETDANVDKFAPAFQAGYWGHVNPEWMWGFKALYKYLDARTDTGLNSLVRLQANHEFNMFLMFGREYSKGMVYVGFGPTLITADSKFSASALGTDLSFNSDETMWGGGAQLGLTYYIKPDWFFDMAYTYVVTADYTLSNSFNLATNANLNLNRKVSVTAQEFMVTLNKVFAM